MGTVRSLATAVGACCVLENYASEPVRLNDMKLLK